MTHADTAAAPSQTVSVDDVIDQRPVSFYQWRVVILCALAAMLDGFDAQATAFVAPVIAPVFSIQAAQMGALFSSAFIGLMIGAFIFGPLADWIGRRPVIIASTLIMGVFALLTASAQTFEQLLAYRLLTGLGLGGAMSNVNTLTAEFAPKRMRALLMTVMFAGFPAGAVLGGLVSAQLIPQFGWQSVFILGGVAPLALCVVLLVALPESVRFRARRNDADARIGRTLKRIDRCFAPSASQRYTLQETGGRGGSVLGLFREGRGGATLLLWAVFFCNLLMIYTIGSWLPMVMTAAGLPLERAIIMIVLFNLGGVVGGLLLAWLIDRHGALKILPWGFLGAAGAVSLIGMTTGSSGFVAAAVFAAGATVVGAQFGMNALAAGLYPTWMRATGLGWALAMGRVGSVIGPVLAGTVIAQGWTISSLFLAAAAPALICVVALAGLGRVQARG